VAGVEVPDVVHRYVDGPEVCLDGREEVVDRLGVSDVSLRGGDRDAALAGFLGGRGASPSLVL
jgi:hypothetical protein